ncbi:MAG TPA: STAS domain-containing protein [Chitinophagaceae bacterium]|jgi:anti-anti-sigma factor|nr:STAS domain-containing protein [Chitinophagaceae bacterium]
MEVKTDTKEIFTVIRVTTPLLSANMTAELTERIEPLLQTAQKNVVLDLAGVAAIDEPAAEALVQLQQRFYESDASFVCCALTPEVEAFLDSKDLLELMNITPTESEAWDIVQMEEIERELFSGDDADAPES